MLQMCSPKYHKLNKHVLPVTCSVFINSSQSLCAHMSSIISHFFLFSNGSAHFQTTSTAPASLCEKHPFQNKPCLWEKQKFHIPAASFSSNAGKEQTWHSYSVWKREASASAVRVSSVQSFNNFFFPHHCQHFL